ncbi:MAG: hypothetical protein ACRC1G_01425 [Bradyrhizobium sp.]|nr:hypothetical protein [Bradyrhizobium sp.]
MIAAFTMVAISSRLFEAQAPGMLNSVAASSATTREALLAELLRHPRFESARRLREADPASETALALTPESA